jgi:hypothetical protein
MSLLAALVGVAACGGGGGDDAPERVPDVDNVVAALEARDVDALGELVGYRQEACASRLGDAVGPPACRFGEAEGTLVVVVPFAQCEASYLRSGDVPNALEHLLDPEPEVFAAFPVPASAAASAVEPVGEYVVVLSSDEEGAPLGRRLVIEGGKVVLLDFGCGGAPEQMVEGIDDSSYIVPPQGGQTPTEGS